MAARLILNADDFGLTHGINRAVSELHSAGALTSATLMANGPAFDDAVAIARAHPSLGIGCHIVLTDGSPVSHPDSIPSLLGPDRKTFRPSLRDFLLAVLCGSVTREDILREASAQVKRLRLAGLAVTHLDTHKHTHVLPAVAEPLLLVAEEAGIPAIRNPFEPAWSRHVMVPHTLRGALVASMGKLQPRFQALPQLRDGSVRTSDGSVGIASTGKLSLSALQALLRAMPDGVWELVCHPGYNDAELDTVRTRLRATRDIERSALLEVFGRESPHPSRPELIHYGDIGTLGVHVGPAQHHRGSGNETNS